MSSSKIERYHFYALLALICWLPIPNGSNYIWGYTIVELFSFIIVFSWIWTLSSKYNFNQLKPYRSFLYCIGIFLIWAFVQQIQVPIDWLDVVLPATADIYRSVGASMGSISVDPSKTFVEFVKGCSYLSIVFMIFVLTTSEKRLRLLALVMFISGILQALYGEFLVLTKINHLFFENNLWIGIATGSFISRTHYANFLMLTLSIGIGLLVTSLTSSKSKKNFRGRALGWVNTLLGTKALLRIGIIIMVIALVMTHSRMGNTAFFTSMTICCLFALVFMKHKTRGLILLFGSMLIIDIIIVSSWFGLEKVQDRLQTTTAEQESRDEVLKYGIELVRRHPISGYGGGSFSSSYQSVQGPGIKYFYYYAHNEYLQFSAEYGLIATLMLGSLVLLSLWHVQYAIRKRRSNLMRGMAFATMMAIIGNLIHATVDFPLQIPANTIYFIILLAIGWISRFKRSDGTIKRSNSIRPDKLPTSMV